jgi:hypothetical protein
VAFIVGFAVRPLAIAALGMDISIMMLGNSRIPPFFTAMHLFVLVSGAGRYYGLDGWILERTADAKGGAVSAARWLIDLPVFKREYTTGGVATFSLVAVYFFLTMGSRSTGRFTLVALELALFSGLIALGLYAAKRYDNGFASLAAMLRIFVGIRFLHEIFTRVNPGVNAMPGFASAEAQTETFTTIAANHWSLFGGLIETLILPAMGLWVLVFGVVQLAVGVALVLGYRTRLAGIVGMVYLATLMSLGMTRLVPFVLGLLVPVVALAGGRILSLDSLRQPAEPVRFGLPVPVKAVPALLALMAINAIAATVTAFQTGITPDGYTDSMTSMVTAFVAIFSGLLALVGWLQQHPTMDHSGEVITVPDTEPTPVG